MLWNMLELNIIAKENIVGEYSGDSKQCLRTTLELVKELVNNVWGIRWSSLTVLGNTLELVNSVGEYAGACKQCWGIRWSSLTVLGNTLEHIVRIGLNSVGEYAGASKQCWGISWS
jgi:hypothetical protein